MSRSAAIPELRRSREEHGLGVLPTFVWQSALVGASFLGVWLQAINHLRAEWTVNPQYSYGWSVPPLAFLLIYRRWGGRPAPGVVHWKFTTIIVIALAAFLLLPARIISIANPDWRLLSWTVSMVAVIISLGGLNLVGGMSWVRYFLFPVAFLLVAAPWPMLFEQTVVQGLMRLDAAIVVQVLNGIGTIAVQRGNVIELSTGLVGIADACTGIRSLQSTLMISLFLGEYYRITASSRLLLVIAGTILGFVCNLVRTLLLCLVASAQGVEAVQKWHDWAGLTILLFCTVGLWLLSMWMASRRHARSLERAEIGVRSLAGIWPMAAALLLWIGLIEICAAGWYHARGTLVGQSAWSINWPTDQTAYATLQIPEAAQELLLYSDGGGAKWTGGDGHSWMMYYFHWLPGRTAARFVKFHRPDICLPASGMVVTRDNGVRLLTVHGTQLPIHSYRFADNGVPLHVFYCYWDARSSYVDGKTSEEEDWSARGRVRAALRGQREAGAQMLEIAVSGYEVDQDAEQAFLSQLEKIVLNG